MMWMLEAEPEDRPTAKQALRHHWFKCDKQVLRDLLLYNSVVCSSNLDKTAKKMEKSSDSSSFHNNAESINNLGNSILGSF